MQMVQNVHLAGHIQEHLAVGRGDGRVEMSDKCPIREANA